MNWHEREPVTWFVGLIVDASFLCLRPAAVDRKPPELTTLTDGYQIRI